jgi:two-component system, cell cycle response regulator
MRAVFSATEMYLRPREFGAAKVLIVDDDEGGAQKVAEAVAELGHETVIATGWTEALRCFGPDIDLVLMDAVMPMVDGFKLTRILRSRALSYTPIVFLTGLDDAAAKARGMTAGADDFLTKPFDALELRVRLTAMLRIRRLVQELESERQSYARMAHLDALTGVPNRRSYDARLITELEHARRIGRPLSLLVIDIDLFKPVNDTLGHAVGDEVLAMMGEMLRSVIRRDDLAFRYGGEEFTVLARDTTVAQAGILAERIRATFEARSQATAAGRLTCSIGISTWTPAMPEIDLFALADENLYTAKRSGRNQVVGPTPDPTPAPCVPARPSPSSSANEC